MKTWEEVLAEAKKENENVDEKVLREYYDHEVEYEKQAKQIINYAYKIENPEPIVYKVPRKGDNTQGYIMNAIAIVSSITSQFVLKGADVDHPKIYVTPQVAAFFMLSPEYKSLAANLASPVILKGTISNAYVDTPALDMYKCPSNFIPTESHMIDDKPVERCPAYLVLNEDRVIQIAFDFEQ